MASLQKPPPTWAQLTYTSADSVTGAKGGWGIKERSAITTDLMASEMLKGVSTRIVEASPTSNFPSDEELWTRPRRLLFRLVNRQPTMWHAATAGPDATGRPGNVYTHAAMLASPDATLRPIEYWRSDGWLTPFGAVDVTAAKVGDLRPGTAITRHSILEFIDHDEREYAVEWLLAAVTHAVNSRQTLVLAAGSPDEAAGWIGVLSFLTAPALARRISWVTYDRAGDVEVTAQRGINIICVPREDLSELLESRPTDMLILDPHWTIDVPGEDKTWVAHGGQAFPADPDWSGAFLDFLALPTDQRMRVLVDIDGVVAALDATEVAVLPFHWPLTMALLSDGEAVVNNRDDVLFSCMELAPASCLTSPAGKRLVVELISDSSVDDVIKNVPNVQAALAEAILFAAAERYVDGGWRDGSRWPELMPSSIERFKTEVGPRIRAALHQAAGDADGTDLQVLAAAKLLSFVLKQRLEPERRTAAEPDVVGSLLGKVEPRVTSAGSAIEADDRQDLLARLLPAPVFPAPPAPPSAAAPLPRAMERQTSIVQPAIGLPESVPAWEPRAGSSELQSHEWQHAPQLAAPNTGVLPDVRESMIEGLRALPPGSDAALGVARSILMMSGANPPSHLSVSQQAAVSDRILQEATAHLLLAEPFWSTEDGTEGRRADMVFEALAVHPPLHDYLRQELLGWIAVAESLRETEAAINYGAHDARAADVLRWLQADRTSAVLQLAEAVQKADVLVAARLVAAGIYRGIMRQPNSVLGLQESGGEALGIAGVRLGVSNLDATRLGELREASSPYLFEFNRRHGTAQVVKMADDILGEHHSQTTSKRGRNRGR